MLTVHVESLENDEAPKLRIIFVGKRYETLAALRRCMNMRLIGLSALVDCVPTPILMIKEMQLHHTPDGCLLIEDCSYSFGVLYNE
jgi:hypothetical protein